MTLMKNLNGVDVEMSADEEAAIRAEWAANDAAVPPPRKIDKSLVLSRLTDAQLGNALAAMTNRQKEQWRSPDHPAVNVDDPDLLAVLKFVGADPAVVLAK